MQSITKTIEVYEYAELSQTAKDKAINDYINDYLCQVDWTRKEYTPDYITQASEQCELLQTPWFFGAYIYEYGKEDIEHELSNNHYTINGEVYIM